MNYEAIAKLAQNCIQHHPAIVLGSGSSAPHGIRGMAALACVLQQNVVPDGGAEERSWRQIQEALTNGDGLEVALQRHTAPASLVQKIVAQTWLTIAEDDLKLLESAAAAEEHLPLADLIRGLFRSANRTISVVTTNYDRVAEIAADASGHIHANGFSPGLIRRREGADPIRIHRGNFVARTVRIWKVHGSLDWFEDKQGQPVSLPLRDRLLDGFSPLIVTPGVSKYERTYDEPFRTAIQGADVCLSHASAILCVGFGFRDGHIQPKLVERCRQQNIPIVVLARTLTAEAREFLRTNAGTRYLALERCQNGTRCFTDDHPDGTELPGHNIWSLPDFNEMVF
ncbi:MAG: SIR2 family protein [Abyssibacter sp.]|jgi:hypothetical protein|nr:SIR2 family protein [Abyssibacter sp.]MCK5858039.1 SIR2 family protein [Abyssibacter sp.]